MDKDIMVNLSANRQALLNRYELITVDNELDLQLDYNNELSLSSNEP